MTDLYQFIVTLIGITDGEYAGFAVNTARNRLALPLRRLRQFLCNEALPDDNFYFNCSSLNGHGFEEENCICTASIVADVDVGKIGHKKHSPFHTLDEALRHVGSLPIKPSCVWCTGHGLQAAYLMRDRISYANDDAALFHEGKARLFNALQSDKTSSVANIFRVPGSVNAKPNCDPVLSYFIQPLDTNIRYTPADIINALPPVPAKVCARSASACRRGSTKVSMVDVAFGDIPSPDKLDIPSELSEILSTDYPEGTRSEAFFSAVIGLHACGATLECIKQVLARNASLVEKYADRLDVEILRCVGKVEECQETQYLRLSPPNTVEYACVAIEEEA